MQVLLVEPFFTGSHRAWAEGLAKHFHGDVQLLTLPGRHWKYRMGAAAITLANQFLQSDLHPQVILASDMLDLASFTALCRQRLAKTRTVLYMHENQVTYPWSKDDADPGLGRDINFGMINIKSALAADQVLFNSNFHRDSFLEALSSFLKQFPDFHNLHVVDVIQQKSRVLYLGLDLARFEPMVDFGRPREHTLLYNHRWEYDKNPEGFFKLAEQLADEDYDFKLIVLGEEFRNSPPVFKKAEKQFADRILHFGYAADFDRYARLLGQATVLPVTSQQEFFGISVIEAAYCGATPLLPRRLTYPELFSGADFYDNTDGLLQQAKQLLSQPWQPNLKMKQNLARFNWPNMISEYEHLLAEMA